MVAHWWVLGHIIQGRMTSCDPAPTTARGCKPYWYTIGNAQQTWSANQPTNKQLSTPILWVEFESSSPRRKWFGQSWAYNECKWSSKICKFSYSRYLEMQVTFHQCCLVWWRFGIRLWIIPKDCPTKKVYCATERSWWGLI